MKNLDADDEALNRWKATLLQGAESAGDGPHVKVESMVVVGVDKGKLEGPPAELSLDLTGRSLLPCFVSLPRWPTPSLAESELLGPGLSKQMRHSSSRTRTRARHLCLKKGRSTASRWTSL